MRYELKHCNICGSEDIVQIDKQIVGLDTCFVYKCKSCDTILKAKPKDENKPIVKNEEYSKNLSADEIYDKTINSILILTSKIDENCYSSGTGFVISDTGYIVTNAHVITNVKETDEQINFNLNDDIKARTISGIIYDVEIVNLDINKDIAILKLEDSDLKPLKLVNCSSLKNGQTVLTIGNSKGEGLSITEGLISDKERKCNSSKKIMVSVPVNTGNSGGPLFNLSSEVIGVITSGKKDAVAMNYAIPSDEVLNFIRKTEEKEEIKIL